MAKRKKAEAWISSREAISILSANSGHAIAPAYLRQLAARGHVDWRWIDGRTKEYLREDVEAYRVKQIAQRGQEHT